MNQLSSVGTNPATSVPIQPNLLGRNQNQAGSASTVNTTTAHTSRNDTQDLIALQRDNFPAYVKEMQTRLAPEDRANSFAYSLGPDIPIEIKRQIFAEWQSGQNAPNVEIGPLSGSNATFDETKGRNGTISINGDLLSAGGTRTGQMEAFAAWGHMEEVGHWGDMRAQQLMGRPGADAVGDEGARFAYMSLPGLIEGRNPQTMLADYSIKASNGTEKNFKVDTVVLKALATEKLSLGSFATENRIGGRENFGPEGHYQTTYITALGVALNMGVNPKKADEMANRMALGSQLPDMLANYDAFSQAMSKKDDLILDAKQLAGGNFSSPSHWTPAEQRHLENIYEGLHAIPRGENASIIWRNNEREETAAFIKQSIANNQFLEAGVAIHRYGDLHAHVKSDGIPYSGDLGHGTSHRPINGFDPHAPDYLYEQNYLGQASLSQKAVDYQASLANVIAEGVSAYQRNNNHPISQEKVKEGAENSAALWRIIYDASLATGREQKGQWINGSTAQTTTETIFRNTANYFINRVHSENKGIYAPLPIDQMHVGGGYAPTAVDQKALDAIVAQFRAR